MPKFTPTTTVDSENMKMPVIGIGTWMSTPEEIDIVLNAAIDAGYRHIDTAYAYMNEKAIGDSLKKIFEKGKVKREDLFIVTKLPHIGNRPEDVPKFIQKSLDALQLSYIDLYLVHLPIGVINKNDVDMFPLDENGEVMLDYKTDHIATWKAMEAQVDAGRTKSIGISNFNLRQVKRLVENSRIRPANLQVELHVYFQQKELVSYCKEKGITICAYAPLGSPALPNFNKAVSGDKEFSQKILKPMEDPVITDIAAKHKKTPAQVLLRFLTQYGVATIPKSVNPDRIKQNIDIFDFELNADEYKKIINLDKGEDGRMFGGENNAFFAAMKKHPECFF